MNVFVQFFLLIGTSLIWGVTNPLIKNKGVFIKAERKTGIFSNLIGRILSLFLNWKIVLPIAVNQLGSIFFFVCIKYTGNKRKFFLYKVMLTYKIIKKTVQLLLKLAFFS